MYADNLLKIYYTVSGFLFRIYFFEFKVLYILFSGVIFYFSKHLVRLGIGNFKIIAWMELFVVKYLIGFLEKKIKLGDIKIFNKEGKNSIDDLSWEILLIYNLFHVHLFLSIKDIL